MSVCSPGCNGSPDYHYNQWHFRQRKPAFQNNTPCIIKILMVSKLLLFWHLNFLIQRTARLSRQSQWPGSPYFKICSFISHSHCIGCCSRVIFWNPACWHFRNQWLSLEKIGTFYVHIKVCDLYQQWNDFRKWIKL